MHDPRHRASVLLSSDLLLQRARMRGLVETNLAAARQSHGRSEAPVLFLDVSCRDALPFQPPYGRSQVVAHQIENGPQELVRRVALNKAPAGRMDGDFGGRQREDEPSLARVHGAKSEDVTKEATIGFGILAVQHEMSARDRKDLLVRQLPSCMLRHSGLSGFSLRFCEQRVPVAPQCPKLASACTQFP